MTTKTMYHNDDSNPPIVAVLAPNPEDADEQAVRQLQVQMEEQRGASALEYERNPQVTPAQTTVVVINGNENDHCRHHRRHRRHKRYDDDDDKPGRFIRRIVGVVIIIGIVVAVVTIFGRSDDDDEDDLN